MTFMPSQHAAPAPPGIVTIERSTTRLVAALVRDPLASLPDACFTQRMVVTRNFGHRRAYVTDPALVQELLVRHADKMLKTRPTKEALGPTLGDGILTADGAIWRWQRRTLAPAFQPDRLAGLVAPMIAAAETTRDHWLALPDGEMIDLGHEMMRTTYRIIVETMLSGANVDAGGIERGLADLLGASAWSFVMALLKAPRWIPFPGKGRAQAASRLMRQSVEAEVGARRAAGTSPDDLIGTLLAALEPDTGRKMTDAEITDNILTFVLAGHETTAVALTWTFALLAEHPAIVARLEAEIEAVTGGGAVEPRHIAGLFYARQLVSEAMRLYPPAPIIARAVADDIAIEDVALPKGSVVFVPIYAIHRHAALWPQPDAFDPDRFAPDLVKARHRFAYMPFGAGPRVCIGNGFALNEAVAILAVLVRALRLERVGSMPAAQMRLTLRPKVPLRMRILHREAGEGNQAKLGGGGLADASTD